MNLNLMIANVIMVTTSRVSHDMHDYKESLMAQRDEHVLLSLQEACVTRESEAVLRRNAAFNNAFLGIMTKLVQTLSEKNK